VSDAPKSDRELHSGDKLARQVAAKEARKLKARENKRRTIWFGLGMFGVVGWSVAVPTVIGTVLGSWIDHHFPSRVSWTITLMLTGLAVGCLTAWRWVKTESSEEP
jgi:ATP synthase protein I